MDYFDWWPFELFIIGQMSLGLVLLLAIAFLRAPAEELAHALHDAEVQLQKLRALTNGSTNPPQGAEQAAA